jgi:hypothetical protein
MASSDRPAEPAGGQAAPADGQPTAAEAQVVPTDPSPTSAPRPQIQRAAAATRVAIPEPEPTVEPTPPLVVIDMDDNARSNRTPLPTATPKTAPTATSVATPEVAGVQASSNVVDDVLMQSFEPLLAGGRIGLLASGVAALAMLGLKLLRRRPPGA